MLFFFSLSLFFVDNPSYFVSKLSILISSQRNQRNTSCFRIVSIPISLPTECIQFNRDRSCFVTKRGEKKKRKETKNCSPQTTMVNNLSRSLESPSWKKGGKICFNPVGRETQLTVRQFGGVSDLGSGEKIGSRKEDERSKRGVQFSPRVPITIHIALPSRIKLLPLPDFHIFTRKRAAFTIPTGSRFMKGLN